MIVEHEVILSCSSPTACSDQFVARLGHGPSFKMKYDRAGDVAHGSVTIAHRQPPLAHQVRVEIYEQDEAPGHGPRYGSHDVHVKRPLVIPTEQDIRQRLETL